MEAIKKVIQGTVKTLGASRQVKTIITTSAKDRVGDVVHSDGCDYREFLKIGTVLFDHDPARPVAKCISIDVYQDRVEATAQFPPEGTSRDSDEIYGLIKTGVLNGTSIGFQIADFDLLPDRSGMDIKKWTLLEWSFVSVPAQPQALVTQRALRNRLRGIDFAGVEKRKREAEVRARRWMQEGPAQVRRRCKVEVLERSIKQAQDDLARAARRSRLVDVHMRDFGS